MLTRDHIAVSSLRHHERLTIVILN